MKRWIIFVLTMMLFASILVGIEAYRNSRETPTEASNIVQEPLLEHVAIWEGMVKTSEVILVQAQEIRELTDKVDRLQRSYNSLARKFEKWKAKKPCPINSMQ